MIGPVGLVRSVGLVAALEEFDDGFTLPSDETEDENHQDRDNHDETEVGAEAGAEIVGEDDGGETAEADEEHEAADGEFGEASDVTNNIVGETWEKEDGEEDERGGFGIDDEVEFPNGGGGEEFLE